MGPYTCAQARGEKSTNSSVDYYYYYYYYYYIDPCDRRFVRSDDADEHLHFDGTNNNQSVTRRRFMTFGSYIVVVVVVDRGEAVAITVRRAIKRNTFSDSTIPTMDTNQYDRLSFCLARIRARRPNIIRVWGACSSDVVVFARVQN